MSLNKTLRWGLVGVLALLTLVVAMLVLFAFVPIKVDLASQRGLVAATASGYLDRPVKIAGGLHLSTSLWPTVEIANIRIGNPEGFSGNDLLVMKEAKLSPSLLSLLRGKLQKLIAENRSWMALSLEIAGPSALARERQKPEQLNLVGQILCAKKGL